MIEVMFAVLRYFINLYLIIKLNTDYQLILLHSQYMQKFFQELKR